MHLFRYLDYKYFVHKLYKNPIHCYICEDKRKVQQERRKNNKCNHRLSRKGYANLREELVRSSLCLN